MQNHNKPPRRSRLVGALAGLLLASTVMPALAFDPKVEEEIRFNINCAILMLTDPDEHVVVCNPGLRVPGTSGMASTGNAPPPPPPPPPPPAPPEEDDEDDEEEVDPCPGGQVNPCGGCFYPA